VIGRLKNTVARVWERWIEPAAGTRLARLTSNGTLRWHRAKVQPIPFTAYCVYRQRNAELVQQLIRSAPVGSAVHLHALDEIPLILREHTRACGPGMRIPLINRLIRLNPPRVGSPVLIFDDDATFVAGAAGTFCALSQAASLDVAQPAHADGSHSSFRVVRADPTSTARLTRFVESGPVVCFAPGAAARLMPFPDDLRMGWGVDVWWSALQDPPLRLGVIDATPIAHHGAVGVEYDNADEARVLNGYLARAGLSSAHDLDTNVGLTWRPWQRVPKWLERS